MGKLIYLAITSLDGYIEDANGNFDWSAPDEEVHQYINDLSRPVQLELLGRRMYEVAVVWDTLETEGEPEAIRDFAAIWRSTEKIVYSRTLTQTDLGPKARIEKNFEPAAVEALKRSARTDLSIGGAALAAEAFAAGLVDEVQLFISPVSVGGGKPALPSDQLIELELTGERSFGNGVVHTRYNVRH